MKRIIIATRGSKLALYQANLIKKLIKKKNPQIQVELNIIKTKGDKILDVSLSKIGGKGVFVKEIETTLINKQADIAVHSMKDMPSLLPKGLILNAILPREDASDSFISNKYDSLAELSSKDVIGTSSLRRIAQIKPNFKGNIKMLRGNVNTRLQKLDDGEYDAIILATAGLKRLGLEKRIKEKLTNEQMIPACGQGAIGIECRTEDREIINILDELNCPQTFLAVETERAFNKEIGGSCQFPAGCYVEIKENQFSLKAFLASEDGKINITNEISGLTEFLPDIGSSIGAEILADGGQKIIDTIKKKNE